MKAPSPRKNVRHARTPTSTSCVPKTTYKKKDLGEGWISHYRQIRLYSDQVINGRAVIPPSFLCGPVRFL